MSLLPTGDIQTRIQEVRDRVMAKVDEIRGRFGGNTSGGILKLNAAGRLPFLKNFPMLQKGKKLGGPISRFTASGPRVYISDWFFGNSHTLAQKELKERAALLESRDRRLKYPLIEPLTKDSVIALGVAPKTLNK